MPFVPDFVGKSSIPPPVRQYSAEKLLVNSFVGIVSAEPNHLTRSVRSRFNRSKHRADETKLRVREPKLLCVCFPAELRRPATGLFHFLRRVEKDPTSRHGVVGAH